MFTYHSGINVYLMVVLMLQMKILLNPFLSGEVFIDQFKFYERNKHLCKNSNQLS